MQLMMRRPEVQGFVAVTPPATDKDFTFLAPCPSSGVILHGDADTVVPAEAVSRLVDRIQTQRGVTVDLRFINDANHFFTSHLDELMEEMGNYLDDAMPNIGAPAL
jgi:alpha/beta superfamily hydrolase